MEKQLVIKKERFLCQIWVSANDEHKENEYGILWGYVYSSRNY